MVLSSFYTVSYESTGSRGGGGGGGGGVMLIVARGKPYPLALSDSPEDYIGLKGALPFSLAGYTEQANIKMTT